MYLFSRTVLTKYHKLDGLKQQKRIFTSFGIQKPQNKMLAELIPTGGSEGEFVLTFPLAFGGYWQSLASLVYRHITSVSVLSLHVVLPCVCSVSSFLTSTSVILA